MPEQQMSSALQDYVLRMLFLGESSPEKLYLGLTTQDFAVEPTLSSLIGSEPSFAVGYNRVAFGADDWEIKRNPARADSKPGVFVNISQVRWPAVYGWFLTTGDRGLLLGWGKLITHRILSPGDRLEVPVSFRFD